MASLANEVIKLSNIRKVAQKEISKVLDQVVTSGDRGKHLVLDPELTAALRYSGVTKEVFTDATKEIKGITQLRPDPKYNKVRNYVYFVRPEPETMRIVNSHVRAIIKAEKRTSIFIYFFPKKTLMCEHILETEYQLPNDVQHLVYGELDIDLLPLDDDVISMEYGQCFKSLFIDGDLNVLQWSAEAIIKLQAAYFGQIPLIKAKGKYATKVLNMVKRLKENEMANGMKDQAPEIEAMYIVDRATDLLTPMLTQLTYEGCLEEIWGIETGSFDPPFDLHRGTERAEERERAIPVNSDDELYAQIRDKSITKVGGAILKRSRDVQSQVNKKDELSNQGTAQVHQFVRQLPHLLELKRLIGVHTNILEAIQNAQDRTFRKQIRFEHQMLLQVDEKDSINFIEDKINKGDDVQNVLRLMSLLSLTNGGLKASVFDHLKEQLMLSYGIPQITVTMNHMEKCGLITKAPTSGAPGGISFGRSSLYSQLREKLKLWDDTLYEENPADYSYAYSGYAPLLTRTIESLIQSGPGGSGSLELDAIPGDYAELVTPDAEVAGNVRVSIIFVVGGVTLAEISTIRFLAQKLGIGGESRTFLIATTNICSGKKIIDSVVPFELNSEMEK